MKSADRIAAAKCTQVIDNFVDAWIAWAEHLRIEHGEKGTTVGIMVGIMATLEKPNPKMMQIIAERVEAARGVR